MDFHDPKTTWKLTADWGLGSSQKQLFSAPPSPEGRAKEPRTIGEMRSREHLSPELMPRGSTDSSGSLPGLGGQSSHLLCLLWGRERPTLIP